ncbi:DGQHR domain-containing protein (plasmid) [Paenibacillus thiaminolyticus]|uniref:DNA sulfur modification protein DndB n=1 Tax=Paenibacillus thiaminolyticus TaxID=49283 RepID=UPI00232BAF80|nr:DNA sulfur modification protein DndB [Paenibacillus thiaminolyticus]WCF11559.1 DGQHR domain-containing protein [Paenibacillus thiaminolyticus]
MEVSDNKHDLSVDNFATISGIRGKQFGREIYSTVIKFKDLMTFLEVFPEVQRDASIKRVTAIKKYILSGLQEQEESKGKSIMRFFSAITVTARGHVFYDESTQRVAIDTRKSKLSVNDGQHRFLGISEAIRTLSAKINRLNDGEEKDRVYAMFVELQEMVIPIVIFNGISEAEEKQLFHDLNNLAQRPSRSATIRLAQTDLHSKLSRELAEHNRFLNTYGVEMDKMSIHKSNKNLVLLTSVHYLVNELIRASGDPITKESYSYHKTAISGIIDSIFESLPEDVNVKGRYLIEKNYAIKGIANFVAQAKYEQKLSDDIIYKAIKETDWTLNLAYWSKYGATEGKNNGILFAGGEGGVRAVMECLLDEVGHGVKAEYVEAGK